MENDDAKISWGRDLKLDLKRGHLAKFSLDKIRQSTYRPYVKQFLFFDRILNEEVYQFPSIFPIPDIKNVVICVTDKGSEKPFMALTTNHITDLHIVGGGSGSQCFPFYTYAEDGSNRRENITDWSLEQFRARYPQSPISKWEIFHYVYALLYHPEYRSKNRSALEWIVDQYQVSVDTRSGISNDPNNADDPQAIVRLIGQVITVSLATVQIVNDLPPLVLLE